MKLFKLQNNNKQAKKFRTEKLPKKYQGVTPLSYLSIYSKSYLFRAGKQVLQEFLSGPF